MAKGSFQAFEHTVGNYNFKKDEPKLVEWRIENSSNVKVVAFIFIKKGYLEKKNDYKATTKFMLKTSN